MSERVLLDFMALTLVPGLGNKGIKQLLGRYVTPQEVFGACARGAIDAPIRKEVQVLLATPAPYLEQAKILLERLHRGGATAICPTDPHYPSLLAEIADPPGILYVQGQVQFLSSLCVAMVGSRAATTYGTRVSFELSRTLASGGVTVVSGLASGIDSAAHRGALAGHGATIGVLGCGLDVVYPRQNRSLYDQIRAQGLLVSEYPLGTRPDPYRFPARNRIIAGLSKGVVVVEAAKKSGSLITAEMALSEGREVFAVPGQINSFKSKGTHWLLQQGAKLVQSAADILEELGGAWQKDGAQGGSRRAPKSDALDPEARGLLEAIDVYPGSRNELIVVSGLGPARVTELLLLLELEGLIEMLPGDEIRRIVEC